MRTPHKYRDMSPEEQQNLFSNFLIDSWSFSKVNTFARNEKAFEMQYIYNMPMKKSSTTVAGEAYHKALEMYFSERQKGNRLDIATLQETAFYVIDEVPADKWKIQKTTPSIEECKIAATKSVTSLLENFFADIHVYEGELQSVLGVEQYYDEFLTINGVEIPLPCHGIIDLPIRTVDGKLVLIDHKSKSKFTDDEEIAFSIGKQAITYVKLYETKNEEKVDEVWFIENKVSKNKDKSPQVICHKVVLDDNTRRLYEAMLYEPLKRMLEAVSNPDYIYLINENDNFIDKAEIYDFWAQTMLAELGQFVPENKKELIERRTKKIRDVSIATVTPSVIKKFREHAQQFIQYDLTNKDMTKEQKIEHTLRTLGVIVSIPHVFSGYSSDTFLLEVSAGTTMSTIFRYKLDIANALSVPSVRIASDLFVYQGKSYIAIEAQKTREKDLIFDPGQLEGSKIPLGFDNFGQKIVWDIANPSTPHMLVCGSTGSGKSVCIISIIEYAKLMGFDAIEIFDPKHEFTGYNGGIMSVYNDIEDIETVMEALVDEMNILVKNGKTKRTLVIFDEFADAVANSKTGSQLDIYEMQQVGTYAPKKNIFGFMEPGAPKMKRVKVGTKKSLEENLRVLLQKGRSVGYRIVAATQRASVKVITGDAKTNFGVLVSFKVPKEVDSKVILDESGAESLSGKGDGLIKSPQYGGIVRFQAFYKPVGMDVQKEVEYA